MELLVTFQYMRLSCNVHIAPASTNSSLCALLLHYLSKHLIPRRNTSVAAEAYKSAQKVTRHGIVWPQLAVALTLSYLAQRLAQIQARKGQLSTSSLKSIEEEEWFARVTAAFIYVYATLVYILSA